jgi:hypothetical protein
VIKQELTSYSEQIIIWMIVTFFCYSSLLSDSGASEDEGFNSLSGPFATLQRHSSLGKDDPDDERSFHHMHRLR